MAHARFVDDRTIIVLFAHTLGDFKIGPDTSGFCEVRALIWVAFIGLDSFGPIDVGAVLDKLNSDRQLKNQVEDKAD